MRFKKTEWEDITKRCRVSHYSDDPNVSKLKRAYLYEIDDGSILWRLGDRGWRRETTHMNGHYYCVHLGRIYRRRVTP